MLNVMDFQIELEDEILQGLKERRDEVEECIARSLRNYGFIEALAVALLKAQEIYNELGPKFSGVAFGTVFTMEKNPREAYLEVCLGYEDGLQKISIFCSKDTKSGHITFIASEPQKSSTGVIRRVR